MIVHAWTTTAATTRSRPDSMASRIPLTFKYYQYYTTEAMKRLSRAEQAGRNRALVLDAARQVFLARGYHGATLEQIAKEAGFPKGVVYSQFDSKADLFLALLEARIEERAAEHTRLAESLPALSVGTTLEQSAHPAALGGDQVAARVAQVLETLARPLAPVPATGSAAP